MTVQQPANLTWQLYRMLLRRARQMEQQKTSFCLRQPPFGRFENATRALADDHLHQHIFEGIIDRWGLRGALDVPAMPLTGCSLLQCIRSAFRHPRTVTQQQILQQVCNCDIYICQSRSTCLAFSVRGDFTLPRRVGIPN